MLEMLAVLTIASVVTIGGVGGYQAAMKRHQTNTILEGAAQRAIAVSQQMALGTKPENIGFGEFPKEAGRGASFPQNPKPRGEEFFSIPVTGLDDAACKQLQTMAGNALRRVECHEKNGSVTAELIYHKDLSSDAGTVPEVGSGGNNGNSATHAYDNNKEWCENADYKYCDSNNTCITKEETCPGEEIVTGNCDAYLGTTLEEPQNIEGREYVGLASDNVHWCYCPAGEFYTDHEGCKPSGCSKFHPELCTTYEECIQIEGGYWSSIGGGCLKSPLAFKTEEECTAKGYYWVNDKVCSPTQINCDDCHYFCESEDVTLFVDGVYTKSENECPLRYSRHECEKKGYYYYSPCDMCGGAIFTRRGGHVVLCVNDIKF